MLDEDADLYWYDYEFRQYDPQIGRFPQLDPLTDDYPFLTPYQYASDEPKSNIDIDGLEAGGATGGAVSAARDFSWGASSSEFAFHFIMPDLKVAKPAETAFQLTKMAKLSLDAINIAAIVVRAQLISGTTNKTGSTPQVQAQLQRAVDDFVKQHEELSDGKSFS